MSKFKQFMLWLMCVASFLTCAYYPDVAVFITLCGVSIFLLLILWDWCGVMIKKLEEVDE